MKRRDFYDFLWYLGRQIPCNVRHLQARMTQTGHWKDARELDAAHCASFCGADSNRWISIRQEVTYARSSATKPIWSCGTAPSSIPGLVIALPVGIYSAIRRNSAADYVGRTAAVIGLATPNFWLALMVIIFPAIWWGWSPPMRLVAFTEDPLGNLGVFIIPSLILGTAASAGTMRLTRTMMLEVLRQDYIRTAWSKGLKERVVIMRHAIKNALIPVVTLIGMQLPILVGGAVIMENIFNLPGLGRLLVTALEGRDYPMVSGVNLFFATAVVGINLMIDLIYPYLDPRVRYE